MASKREASAVLTVFLLAVVALGGASAQSAGDYVIGTQDVLAVTVFDQADLSGRYTVEADGSFTFPLVGRVHAGGRTLRQFEAELKRLLADGLFLNPQVAVAVEQYRSQRIFVVGEVRQPGSYALTGDMTVVETLARAGSMTPAAAGEIVVVRARNTARPTLPDEAAATAVIRVNVKDLESGNMSRNVALKDGDTLFVPRAETVYVFGEVKNSGSFTMQRDMTVLQALALAGGVTDAGAVNRIKIVRFVNGEKKDFKIKLTDHVQPGDTVVVPARYF
jgi:polysaccharide biosynthesis/export protein